MSEHTYEDVQRGEEAVGEAFDRAMFMETRRRTWNAIGDIAAAIHPGMVEEDAVARTHEILEGQGLLRGWHGVKVRFGANTLKHFPEPSEPGTVLRDNDIFFVDIGPVFDKWEGDGGDTFTVGNDPAMIAAARDAKDLFNRVQDKWRRDSFSGAALYRFADNEAKAMGYNLNLDMTGHRLSDFPHGAIHRGGLAHAPYRPTTGLWVLEIQIRHPTLPIGAFYEDLLFETDEPLQG